MTNDKSKRQAYVDKLKYIEDKYSTQPYVPIQATKKNAQEALNEAYNTIIELEILLAHSNYQSPGMLYMDLFAGTNIATPWLEKTLTTYIIQIGEKCSLLAKYIRKHGEGYLKEHTLLYELALSRHKLVHSYSATIGAIQARFIATIYSFELKHTLEYLDKELFN